MTYQGLARTALVLIVGSLFFGPGTTWTGGSNSEAGHGVAYAQQNQWLGFDSPDFSFQYPAGWALDKGVDANGNSRAQADDANNWYSIGVAFTPGFVNKADTFNQCASVDAYLNDVYKNSFEPLATGTGQYPYTTVTRDDFKPGWLGGKSVYITIVHVEKWQKPVSLIVYINAIPRQGGLYTVSFKHPSEAMGNSEPFRQAFFRSIMFKSPALERNAYCNYLGK